MKYFKPHTIVSVVVDKNDDNDDVNIILGLHVKSGDNRVKNRAKQKNKQTGFGCFGEDSPRFTFHGRKRRL